jgi:hypothetical protein
MQAGVDADMENITMPVVNTWMDYTVHKVLYRIFADIHAEVSTKIAALKTGADDTQISNLSQLNENLGNAVDSLNSQLKIDAEKNKLDPQKLLLKLNYIRAAIIKNVSPALQQELAFTSSTLK